MTSTTALRRTCSARQSTIASALHLIWFTFAVLAGVPARGLPALGPTGTVLWLIGAALLLLHDLHRQLTGRVGERCTHCAGLDLHALHPRHRLRRMALRAWHPAWPVTRGLLAIAAAATAAFLLIPGNTTHAMAWITLSGVAVAEMIRAVLHWHHCRRLADCPRCAHAR